MKLLKVGFVAIVALCVMSFTVADHAGIFKKSPKFAPLCYTSGTYSSGSFSQTTACPGVLPFSCAIPGAASINPSTCTLGSAVICCVNLATPSCTVVHPNDGLQVTADASSKKFYCKGL